MTPVVGAILHATIAATVSAVCLALMLARANKRNGELAAEVEKLRAALAEDNEIFDDHDRVARVIAHEVARAYPAGQCPVGMVAVRITNRDDELVVSGEALVEA